MRLPAAAIGLTVLLLPHAAQALCRDEIKELKPRVDRLKNSDPQRYQFAIAWWGKAVEAEPGSESRCVMYVERTRKALAQAPPQVAQCKGPDADPAHCDAAGNPVAAFHPPGGLGMGGIGGAAGGAGGAGVAAGSAFAPPGTTPGASEH